MGVKAPTARPSLSNQTFSNPAQGRRGVKKTKSQLFFTNFKKGKAKVLGEGRLEKLNPRLQQKETSSRDLEPVNAPWVGWRMRGSGIG